MRLKQTVNCLTVVATGTLLMMLFYSYSQDNVIAYRHRHTQKETRVFRKSEAIPTLASHQKKNKTSSTNRCLKLQHYIINLIKSHHPDSAKLIRNKHLFKRTRADPKTNSKDCYSDFSLKLFHSALYARAKLVLRNYTCYSNHTVIPDYKDLLIYSPYHNDLHRKGDSLHTDIHTAGKSSMMSGSHSDITHRKTTAKSDVIKLTMTDVDLVLVTSMYHSTVRQYLFINTLINWSNLTAPSRVQPVLFLTHMDIVEKSGIVLYVAYLRGWIIAVAPDCLESRYPMLQSMFLFGWDIVPHAYWYGYANGDIQFTPTFMKTLSKINQYNTQVNATDQPIVFICSKRTDVNVNILTV